MINFVTLKWLTKGVAFSTMNAMKAVIPFEFSEPKIYYYHCVVVEFLDFQLLFGEWRKHYYLDHEFGS